MKARHPMTRRLLVEELESRTVLSASPAATSLVPSFFEQYHAATANTNAVSTNWSGYAVQTSFSSPASNAISAVSGTWVVPTVTGASTAYSSMWVGIDGYSSSSVEQIGTEADTLANGKTQYYAWYEMYPSASYSITTTNAGGTFTVNPGDTITASVTYVNTTTSGKHTYENFLLTITDTLKTPVNGVKTETYSTTQSISGAARSSAEWIMEAPSSNSGVLPLADFGTASFTAGSATVNGKAGAIGAFTNTGINMETSNGSLNASTSTLTASGGFTVTYVTPAASTPPPRGGGHHWWFSNNAGGSPDGTGGYVVTITDVPASTIESSNARVLSISNQGAATVSPVTLAAPLSLSAQPTVPAVFYLFSVFIPDASIVPESGDTNNPAPNMSPPVERLDGSMTSTEQPISFNHPASTPAELKPALIDWHLPTTAQFADEDWTYLSDDGVQLSLHAIEPVVAMAGLFFFMPAEVDSREQRKAADWMK